MTESTRDMHAEAEGESKSEHDATAGNAQEDTKTVYNTNEQTKKSKKAKKRYEKSLKMPLLER